MEYQKVNIFFFFSFARTAPVLELRACETCTQTTLIFTRCTADLFFMFAFDTVGQKLVSGLTDTQGNYKTMEKEGKYCYIKNQKSSSLNT